MIMLVRKLKMNKDIQAEKGMNLLVSSPMVGSMSSPVQGQGPGMVSYEDWIIRDKILMVGI